MFGRKWITECVGENLQSITNIKNNNIAAQIKILGDKDLSICDHEIINSNKKHTHRSRI
jgi:hypothetical protein